MPSAWEDGLDPELASRLRRHAEQKYRGVFPLDHIDAHIEEYVGLTPANQLVADLQEPGVRRVLDVGCGYGAFVLACRLAGLDAVGIDVAPFDVAFARDRLRRSIPDDDPEQVYRVGDAHKIPFAAGTFDAVTLWNVLEHIADTQPVLSEVARVLRPGGAARIVCPNYLAPRREAHYHIAWPPLLPRSLAMRYLRLRGRDPAFFASSIHYRTNGGVRRSIRRAGLVPEDPRTRKLGHPDTLSSRHARVALRIAHRVHVLPAVRFGLWCGFVNPLRPAVRIVARKPWLEAFSYVTEATR